MTVKTTRYAKVYINGRWEKVQPLDIHKGMTFRLFETDGTPVLATNGTRDFHAVTEPFEDGEQLRLDVSYWDEDLEWPTEDVDGHEQSKIAENE